MTTFREGLRRGRSHLILAVVLVVAGTIVVRLDDAQLTKKAQKPVAAAQATPASH